MAQTANIVVNDGAATPVAHTFHPTQVAGATAKWRENQASLPLAGQGTLELHIRETKNGVMQVHLSIATPALEQITGNNGAGYTAAPKVAYTPLGGLTFNFDKRTTTQQRKDLRILMKNALDNAIVIDAVDNLNPAY